MAGDDLPLTAPYDWHRTEETADALYSAMTYAGYIVACRHRDGDTTILAPAERRFSAATLAYETYIEALRARVEADRVEGEETP